MGVNEEHVEHNHQNRVILEGARKLGYAAKTVPQNTGHGEHYCGYCTLGCASGGKKGPTESFLVDAAQAGASFMEGFCVEKVLFTNVNGRKVASGVQGTWKSRDSHLGLGGIAAVERKVIIKAKKVVISAGTLQSPLLLLRSGLNNPQIGRNLYLHPGKYSSLPAPPNNPHHGHLLFVTQLWELVLSLMRRLTPGRALH
jgi:choline dehydrogenase-like flavoprotein